MDNSYSGWTLIASAIFSLAVAAPALAQSDTGTESRSVRSASQSTRAADSDKWAASKNSYYAAKTALRDTEITAKVKSAFHHDATTHPYDIDVTTAAGVVTLEGKIPSHDVAVRAKQLAMETEGVKRVRDRMVIISAASPPGYYGHDYSGSSESTRD